MCWIETSRKHAYITLTPLKNHFYIVKLGFTGVYIIVLISAQNIDCGYSLGPPCQGGSNEYHNLCFEQKYRNFYQKISCFDVKNFGIIRLVFIMYIWKRMIIESNEHIYKNENKSRVKFFWARLASWTIRLNSDPHINLKHSEMSPVITMDRQKYKN